MTAYELADWITKKYVVMRYGKEYEIANMLRQQADRIAELEKLVSDMIYEKSSGVYDKTQTNAEPVAYIDHVSGKPKLIDGYVVSTPYDIPLYTTPQTKPLSDEEIKEIYEKVYESDVDNQIIGLARAIEERHGIK